MKSFSKRILAILLVVLITMSFFTVGSLADKTATSRFGDINADKMINAVDALLALKHSVKLIPFTEEEFEVADVDANNQVNATDALYILQYAVDKIEKFPAEIAQEEADAAAAQAVDSMITAIGAVTLDSESAIVEARASYEALTDTQKKLVTKLDVLVSAEETLAQLKAEPVIFDVYVTDEAYGAKGDGVTNDRAAIQAAIDDASAAGGGTVRLDSGKTFVTANLWLKSNVELHFEDGAKLKQTSDGNSFVELQEDGTYAPFTMTYGHVIYPDREWDVGSCYNYPFLFAREIENFKVTGKGIIEMVRGQSCNDTLHICPIVLNYADNFELSGFTIQNYNAWAVNCRMSTNGLFKGITIKNATDSAADGIGIVSSQNIRVTECNLTTSDDGIKVSATYGDPRRGPWMKEFTPIPCKNIEIDNNHCVVTWDATKAFALFAWGSAYHDLTQVEISNVYVHDNYFSTMGVWTGNWNLQTQKFEYNGSTSPVKNIRFERNEIGTVQDNFYTLPISDVYGYDCMTSLKNGDFLQGDVYWVSRQGGSAGVTDAGYGYIDGLDQGDAALYQGLKMLQEVKYELIADVKTSGQPVRLFVKDQLTGELIAWQECTATDWQTLTMEFTVPKDGNYHVGVERGDAQSGFAYIDKVTLSMEANVDIPEGGENILSTQKPDSLNAGDGIHNMLGVAFATKVDGVITHIRMYTGAQEIGIRYVGLWEEETGTLLLDDYLQWEMTTGIEGWKYLELPKPINVTAGKAYVVGVSSGAAGKYVKGTGQLASALENGNLVTYSNSGRWRDIQNYTIAIPENTGPSHYFRDVVFFANEVYVTGIVDRINALPATITLDDKAIVEAVRAEFNTLTDAQKALVANADKLTDAEKRIAQLEEEARIAAENQAKAEEVMAIIAALPETVTLSNREAIAAARDAFDGLNDAQKALVTNTDRLIEAETQLAVLLAEAARDAVIAAINVLPSPVTLADKAAVESARAAYDALEENQKPLVTNLAKLTEAEAKIKALLEEAKADAENKEKAEAVMAKINAIPETVTLNDKATVTEAANAYAALTDVQKALVTNAAKLTAATERIAQLEEEARIAAENQEKAEAVMAKINAIPETVTLEDKTAVTEARTAYDGLTDDQKSLVTNLDKLTNAEITIIKLETADGVTILATQTPVNVSKNFGPRLFLGTRFSPKMKGVVTKIRVYTGANESGIHYVGLWDYETATLLTQQVYEWNITGGTEGWKEFTLPTAIALTAGKDYVVAVSADTSANAAQTPSANAVYPVENAYITTYTKSGMWADMAVNGQNMPTSTSGECYFRDVVFIPYGEVEEPAPEPTPEESFSILTTQTPVNVNHTFGGPRLFLGTLFSPKVDGTVTKVRMYVGTKASGIHYVGLWDYETATLLTQQVYEWDITGGTQGWQEFTLPTAIQLTAGKQYVVAVSADPSGYAAETPSANAVFPIESDYFTTYTKSSLWADMAVNGQNMPTSTSGECYFRDIVFVPAD